MKKIKKKNFLRKHAQFQGFKSEMDFEVFIRDRADHLEDLGTKARMYDYFLGTVIRGFDHLLRLKEEHNQSKPKSRLFLAEADGQYVYCRAVVGGIRTFYKNGKETERLLLLDPTYKISLLKVENPEEQSATFYDAGQVRKDKVIDNHIWVDIAEMRVFNADKRYPLAIGAEIGFTAKVYSYKGKTTHDVRGKQVKFGLKEIAINEIGYQTYIQKYYVGKFVGLLNLDFRDFELLTWDKAQECFVKNEKQNQKYYDLIRRVNENLTEIEFDEEFYQVSSKFLFEFDPLSRKALEAYSRKKRNGEFNRSS
jgi:hypothetical protein